MVKNTMTAKQRYLIHPSQTDF